MCASAFVPLAPSFLFVFGRGERTRKPIRRFSFSSDKWESAAVRRAKRTVSLLLLLRNAQIKRNECDINKGERSRSERAKKELKHKVNAHNGFSCLSSEPNVSLFILGPRRIIEFIEFGVRGVETDGRDREQQTLRQTPGDH